jgi:hypothetical protein
MPPSAPRCLRRLNAWLMARPGTQNRHQAPAGAVIFDNRHHFPVKASYHSDKCVVSICPSIKHSAAISEVLIDETSWPHLVGT